MFSRYGIEYSAPLGETVKRTAGGRTYRSHVITIEAPLATSVEVYQARTDAVDAMSVPLTVVQTGVQTWQARTLDEIGGALVGAARIHLLLHYPNGTTKHVPSRESVPRKVGSSVTIVVASPGGVVATTVLDEPAAAGEETLIPDLVLDSGTDAILQAAAVKKAAQEKLALEAATKAAMEPDSAGEATAKAGQKRVNLIVGVGVAVVTAAAGITWWGNRSQKNSGQQNRW